MSERGTGHDTGTITKIAVIGAGNVGGALGVRLAQAGFTVRFGVRASKDLGALLEAAGPNAGAESPEEAARFGELVVLAVPGAVAVQVAESLGGALAGKVVVDCNNPLRWDAGPVWTPPPEGSLAAAIARAVPEARVVKALNTFGAEFHGDPRIGEEGVDVLMAGEDDAKQQLATVLARAGFHPVDAGPLRNASVLENVAMLWIHLATVGGHGRQFALQLVRR